MLFYKYLGPCKEPDIFKEYLGLQILENIIGEAEAFLDKKFLYFSNLYIKKFENEENFFV